MEKAGAEYPNFIEAVRSAAEGRGDGPAFILLAADGSSEAGRVSYPELLWRAHALSARLLEIARPNEPLVLAMDAGLDFICTFFACLYARVVAVPVAPLSGSRPERRAFRLRHIMAAARPRGIVCSRGSAEVLRRALPSLDIELLELPDVLPATAPAAAPTGPPGCRTSRHDPAFIQFTSGSTAAPRGVVVSHGNLLHNESLIRAAFGHTHDSIIAGWLPLFHDMGLVGNLLNTAFCGACAVLMPPLAFMQSPIRWLRAISRYGASTSGGPNFAYEQCIARTRAEDRDGLDLSRWTAAFVGAEPIRASTLRRFAQTFAPYGFRKSSFLTCYGLAESTLIVSAQPAGSEPLCRTFPRASLRCSPGDDPTFPGELSLVSSGSPLPGQRLLIVDPESGMPRADGTAGEVWVSGPSVSGGYWAEADSGATFGARSASDPHSKYLRTGDVGVMADGQLFICGRLKDRFKVRGRSFHASDVELAAAAADERLLACGSALLTIPGASSDRVVLLQEIPRAARPESFSVLASAIQAAVLEQLELRLDTVVLLPAATLPRTSSGKVQRPRCATALAANTLECLARFDYAPAGGAEDPAPESPSQAESAEIRELRLAVCDALGLAPSAGAMQTSLSELGVDSLAAATLHDRLCARFQAQVPLSEVLACDTVAAVVDSYRRAARARQSGGGHHQNDRVPLSRGQQSLYFLERLEPLSCAYNISRAMELFEQPDVGALGRATAELVGRHPILTSRFDTDLGVAYRTEGRGSSIPLHRIDLSVMSGEDLESWLARWHREPMDLRRGPLFAVLLISHRQRVILLLKVHHILCDLHTLTLLSSELAQLYEAHLTGTAVDYCAPEMAYQEFVTWQEQYLASTAGAGAREYWRQQLSPPPARLKLPSPADGGAARRVLTLPFAVETCTYRDFKRCAIERNATTLMALLAAVAAVLGRLSGEYDLVVGVPFSGRKGTRWKSACGYFVNTLPIRLQADPAQSFAELLAEVRKRVLGGYEHGDYPLALIGQEQAPKVSSPTAPFNALLVLESTTGDLAPLALNWPGECVRLGRLSGKSLAIPDETAQADIAFAFCELADGRLAGTIRFRAQVLDEAMASRMAEYIGATIREASRSAACPLSALPPLGAAQVQEVLARWNDTDVDFRAPKLLHELVARQVACTPHAIAVETATRRVTFLELDACAAGVARELRRRKVCRDEVVAVYADRSVESVAALLGTLQAGAAFLPIDPDHPEERSRFVMRDARVHFFLAPRPDIPFRPEGSVQVIECGAADAPPQSGVACRTAAGLHPASGAYVLYTSGSTGEPKGCVIPHEAICNRILWMQRAYGLRSVDRVLHKTAASFDVSLWEIFWPLTCGATLVLAPRGLQKDVTALRRWIRERAISVTHFVPSLARVFFELQSAAGGPLPLRLLVCSGEPLTADIIEKARAAGVPLISNQYGPTEAAIDVSSWDVPDWIGGGVAIGHAIANTRLYVLDGGLAPSPVGAPGELYIAGRGLGRCYLGRPGATAERFLPDPHGRESGARMYRTGDLARRRSDGTLEFLGRRDLQVKVNGVRIELGEIESVLRRHPHVAAAAVILERQKLTAFVVPRGEASLDSAALSEHLQRHLPATMLPRMLVPLASLPTTVSGKLDRTALARLSPQPKAATPGAQRPATPAEIVFTALWSQLFQRPEASLDDHFFDLGGDSILSIRLAALAGLRGYEVTLEDIYRHPTPRELASVARESGHAAPRHVTAPFALLRSQDRCRLPEGLADAYPMGVLQQALMFHDEKKDGYEVYVTSLRVEAPLDTAALTRALQSVITTHCMLRTTFDAATFSEPIQLVHESAPARIDTFDLQAAALPAQEAMLQDFYRSERGRRFEWAQRPLIRLAAHPLSSDRFQLTLSDPFLDGWSVATLLTDLLLGYAQCLAGRDPRGQQLRASYADYVALEKRALESSATRAFWRDMLAGTTPSRLNCVPPRANPVQPVRRVESRLEPALEAGLRQSAHRLGVSLKSLFMCAQARVVAQFSGTRDVVFGVVCNGRPDLPDGDRIVGAHLNVLPFRISLQHQTWDALARECFELEASAHSHVRFPLALLQHEIGQGPLFDTVLNFSNFHVYGQVESHAGFRISHSYASEQTYYPLTTQCHLRHDGSEALICVDYTDGVPDEMPGEFTNAFIDALQAIAHHGSLPHDRVREAPPTEPEPPPEPLIPRPSVPDFLARIMQHATASPDNIAVACAQETLTYLRLAARAQTLAAELSQLGVSRGDRVAVCMDRSCDMVASMFGILLAGASYVPVDPDQPAARVRAMLGQVRPRIAVVDEPRAAQLPADLRALIPGRLPTGSTLPAAAPPYEPCQGNDLAYVIYTSGSTGTPKGVAVTHGGLQNLIDWHLQEYRLGRVDRMSQISGIGFDACAWEIWPTLTAGAALVIAPRLLTLDQESLSAWLSERSISCCFLPTPLYELFAGNGGTGTGSVLRLVLTGGDVLHRHPAPGLPFETVNHYGPAENTVVATFARLAPQPSADLPPSIGRAIRGNGIILTDVFGAPARLYVPGEICIVGNSLARGYWDDPALTAARFVPAPAPLRGARMYRSGDLGYRLPGGDIQFLGRSDRQIKVRGVRVEPAEIEATLSSHPGVSQAVVVVAADDSRPDETIIRAYVVAAESVGSDELRRFARDRLPAAMLPEQIVRMTALPLTVNGKVDRAALPEPPRPAAPANHQDPRDDDPVCGVVARVWSEVLGRQITSADNFFDCGGHSLLATQITTRLRKAFNAPVPVSLIFQYPSLSEFADQLLHIVLHSADPSRLTAALDQLDLLSEGEIASRFEPPHAPSDPPVQARPSPC
jgi:amino acid adenylation domain-containing protein